MIARIAVAIGLTLLAAPGAMAQATLKTAVDGTFAPHAMPKLSGGIEGFNVDLAEAIGKQLGKTVTVDATQFSGLIPALQAGTYDFIVAPVTVSKERAESLLFTEGYLNTDFQFVTKKGAPPITALEELKGKVISVNKGSAYDSWARGLEEKIGWKVESFGTQTDAVQAVISGRAYANVAGNTVIQWAAKSNPQIQLSYTYSTGLVWAVALRKDSAPLRNQLDQAIECLKASGAIAALHEKWFGTKPAAGSAAVTAFPGYGVPDMPGYDATVHAAACK
ncbi:transporter substrate-binding domain-containing protein [Bosea sp. (in: a-proteobacteria)]|uniref:transporter substrate-binding domain-containing protein n=1 Tax=Bosea sp. (in: a-proteobacteria) TaxID=1871050 RepID=UPI001202F07D|nr:transporter substrate-binding domain-containing protein [Bosea sp. (in: a-proteobacteria)]TAJ27495.1 MAG: transporter substrate-binding domain-containing protein [Bosea sp. (in: a-proteobacteria)]